MFFDEVDSFKTIAALRDDADVVYRLEQIAELIQRELFIIHNDRGQGHRVASGSSIEGGNGLAQWPGRKSGHRVSGASERTTNAFPDFSCFSPPQTPAQTIVRV